jgi:hypothetical protein
VPSESMRDGILSTNPRHQPPSAWQVGRYWIFLVRNEFVEYSISGTKSSNIKLLSYFSLN